MKLNRLLRNPSSDVGGESAPAPVTTTASSSPTATLSSTITSTNTSSPGTKSTKPYEVKPVPSDVSRASFDISDEAAELGIDVPKSDVSQSTPEAVKTAKQGEMRSDPKGVRQDKPKAGESVEATPKAELSEKVQKTIGEQIKPSASSRDYSGFNEDEVKHLKQMSNTAFDFASKQLREKKQLEQYRNEVYLQNPEAYKLDPEYKKVQEDSYYATTEAQYWQQQLINIKQGKDWIPLKGWNAKGEPVYDTPQPPTDMAEEDVRQRMQHASQMANQVRGNLQGLQQNYMQRIQQDSAGIQQVQAQKFAWVSNPEVLDHRLNVEGVGEKTVRDVKNDFLSILPTYHRNNVLADVASNMFVALQIYGAEIRSLKAQNQLTETKRGEAMRAEPSSVDKPASGGVAKSKFGGPSVFDDLDI